MRKTRARDHVLHINARTSDYSSLHGTLPALPQRQGKVLNGKLDVPKGFQTAVKDPVPSIERSEQYHTSTIAPNKENSGIKRLNLMGI